MGFSRHCKPHSPTRRRHHPHHPICVSTGTLLPELLRALQRLQSACRAADSHHTGSSPESSRRCHSENSVRGDFESVQSGSAGWPSVLESSLSVRVAAAAVAITVTVTAHHIAVTGASLTPCVTCNPKPVVDMSSSCEVCFKRHLLLSAATSLKKTAVTQSPKGDV